MEKITLDYFIDKILNTENDVFDIKIPKEKAFEFFDVLKTLKVPYSRNFVVQIKQLPSFSDRFRIQKVTKNNHQRIMVMNSYLHDLKTVFCLKEDKAYTSASRPYSIQYIMV